MCAPNVQQNVKVGISNLSTNRDMYLIIGCHNGGGGDSWVVAIVDLMVAAATTSEVAGV